MIRWGFTIISLVLNYQCPNFLLMLFFGFICDFRELFLVKSSKVIAAHRIQQEMNFTQEKTKVVKAVFSIFSICLLLLWKKLAL